MDAIYTDKNGVVVYTHTLNSYSIHSLRGMDKFDTHLNFQTGPILHAPNGVTNESVLHVVLHRLTAQNNAYPCEENELALEGIREAIRQLKLREIRVTKEKEDDSN